MSSVWPLLDLDHLDRTFPTWLRAVETLVGGHRRTSAQIAAGYYATFRRFNLGDTKPFDPILGDALDLKRFGTSMLVTGPVSVKSALSRGVELATAADIANARSAAAGMRFALGGGRDTITRSVAADSRARGWTRVTSGRACDFCASLAGEVFSEASVAFAAHDRCGCSGEPAF